MTTPRSALLWLCLLLCLVFSPRATAHPIPDIPVRGAFLTGGSATLTVRVNPRCFDPDPTTATSLTKLQFQTLSDPRKKELLENAAALALRNLEISFEPLGRIQPQFAFTFTGEGGAPLLQEEDVVVLSGSWSTTIPAGVTGWNVRSAPQNNVSVVFENEINGKPHPRVSVLFPGERSFTLDLTALASAPPSGPSAHSVPAVGGSGHLASTLWSFAKNGFGHVLPEGLDHSLFVLGIFLLCRQWKPLLLQISAFTLAHSVTLALATLGPLSAPPRLVQTLIAATIALLALENLWKPAYSNRRLALVFSFGLIHGLGYASALGAFSIPKDSVLVALAGFNLGVEAGQIAVLALALLLTGWIRSEALFQRWVSTPASSLIGLTGLYWALKPLWT